jgi:hypothetical protein
MTYQNHLYMIMHPSQSLIASQYQPDQFAVHFMSGSTRHYQGKVIFAEIDPQYRNPFFDIDRGFAGLIPHEDGRPKATKFVASYRVLEHVDFDAVQRLYLTTPSAAVLELSPAPLEKGNNADAIRIFAEIVPTRMLVLARMRFPEFGRYITDPDNPKGVPKVFYTQFSLDIDTFLQEFADNPFLSTPFPSLHPSKLRDAIVELQNKPQKQTKGLSLDSNMNRKSYKYVRHGFMLSSQKETKFFPMPPLEEIEDSNIRFWRDM